MEGVELSLSEMLEMGQPHRPYCSLVSIIVVNVTAGVSLPSAASQEITGSVLEQRQRECRSRQWSQFGYLLQRGAAGLGHTLPIG